MLKGYKMLNDSCPNCLTILLEDRSTRKFCVSCCDLDVDTAKDQPEFTDIVREEVSSHPLQPQRSAAQENTSANVAPSRANVRVKVEQTDDGSTSRAAAASATFAAASAAVTSADTQLDCDIETYIDMLNGKIRVTVEQLSQCSSDHRATQLSNIIKACTDAMLNIHKLRAIN